MARRPEILAPAGDAATLRAAIRAGADAVYFGLGDFNARARATNFDVGSLPAAMRELHAHGLRGYVALNTLVFDAELALLERTVRACATAGVDAVIVQDLGVARLVRAVAPGLPIHASTQMTCTDAEGVELARSLGASRVILARELSLDEIAAIRRATDVEIEVFVHGALCISYSGQCLTSEAIGGRSANRGACAQACRLPYQLVVDGVLRDLGDAAFLLSPQDLEASAMVTELARLGVASLKIEGRLKGPEYVAATTALYRRALDAMGEDAPAAGAAGGGPASDDRRAALQTFTRGSGPGFFNGVDHQRLVEGRGSDHRGLPVGVCGGVRAARGRDMLVVRLAGDLARGDGVLVEGGWGGEGETGGRVWGLFVRGEDVEAVPAGEEALVWLGPDRDVRRARTGRRVFKTSDPANERSAVARAARDVRRSALAVRVSGRHGEPFVLEATSSRGHAARIVADARVERARTANATDDVIREKIARLGDTPFELGTLEVDLPAQAMLPLSAINRARRALVEALVESRHRPHGATEVSHEDLLSAASPPARPPPAEGLFVLCRNEEQALAAAKAGADGVVLDFLELTGTGAAMRRLRGLGGEDLGRAGGAHVRVTLAPPRIRKPGEEKIDKYLRELAPDALLVRSLGALNEASRHGIECIGDFSLNVTNRLTVAEVLGRGLSAFTPSFDLDAAQLSALCAGPFGAWAEVVVHHPMPLFHMEHCTIAALLSDGRDHKTCGRPCERHRVSLRDRAGMDHPVEADVGCRNTVFHAAAQSAVGVIPALQRCGVRRFRIELVRESGEEVTRLVEAYRSLLAGRTSANDLRQAFRTLRTEGGYGVVTGSLRVL